MSKKTAFSPPQNAALRAVLLTMHADRSQSELARLLGIAQQNIARLLKDDRSGFGYATASRLAHLAGFAGVDAFLEAKGVATPPESGADVVADARVAS